jgi:predicted nucleic acid-binding protein
MPRPNGYLLDANIVVALVRNNALGQYLDRTYRLTAGGFPFYVPVVVVGELRALALKWHWGSGRQARLTNTLSLFTRLDIGAEAVLDAYAAIDAQSSSVGADMGKNDVWSAAVARVYDLTLLTTDADFGRLHRAGLVDVEWVDPTSKLSP